MTGTTPKCIARKRTGCETADFGAYSFCGHSAEGSGTMKQKKEPAHSRREKRQDPPVGQFQAERTDPQGSYTGRPVNLCEEPVQDADDL